MKLLKIKTSIDTILMVVPDNYDQHEVMATCYNANDNVSAPEIIEEVDLGDSFLNITYEPYFGNKYKDTEFE